MKSYIQLSWDYIFYGPRKSGQNTHLYAGEFPEPEEHLHHEQ